MAQDIYLLIEHIKNQVSDISFVMAAAGRELTKSEGGKVIGILLGHNSQALADNLAVDEIIYCDHPSLAEFTSDAYNRTLIALFSEYSPRVVLFGNTTVGADISSSLAAQLNFPIINSCLKVNEDGSLISQICGGKIMLENQIGEDPTFISIIPGGYKPEQGRSDKSPPVTIFKAPDLDNLKVKLHKYIEPDVSDVDIAEENVLIAVGRGIQTEDNIEIAEEIAQLLGGVVCASRPIIDQGWLPTSRLVGKSGKHVKPKLYFALGISGAPEHIEGMSESETIIAINMDPDAPIFDVAKFGVEFDIFDLVDTLIEQVEEAKNG